MKNSMRRAMISTICMLIVAVMSLTGVTYAWFTAGTDATVSNVEVNVTSDVAGGLQFSIDGATWNSILSASSNTTFDAVSTAGGLGAAAAATVSGSVTANVQPMQFFAGEVDPANSTQIKTTATTEGYFAKTFFVRNISGSTVSVSLKDLESVTASDGKTIKDANAAMRIALVVEDIGSSLTLGSDGMQEEAGDDGQQATAAPYTRDAIIYEPFSTVHTDNAIKYFGAVDGEVSSYRGVNAASGESTYMSSADTDKTTEMTVGETFTRTASDVTLTLNDAEYATVTIYVWLEGQDVDCENSIASGSFVFDLVFEKATN